MSDPYTIIIGLEVHVQLLTESKMFCGCSTKFGAPPNTQTCPVCIGMPGSLPVMNRKAFELSLKTAVALNCEIPHFTKWDRKNYNCVGGFDTRSAIRTPSGEIASVRMVPPAAAEGSGMVRLNAPVVTSLSSMPEDPAMMKSELSSAVEAAVGLDGSE